MFLKLSLTRYEPKISQRVAVKNFWVVLLLCSIIGVILFPSYRILSNTTWQDWLIVLVQVNVLLLYFWLLYQLTVRVLTWRVPELVLVRALADAFEIVAEGGPASWRSISRRGRTARYINEAGSALEGPIARKFTRWAGYFGPLRALPASLMYRAVLPRREMLRQLAGPPSASILERRRQGLGPIRALEHATLTPLLSAGITTKKPMVTH